MTTPISDGAPGSEVLERINSNVVGPASSTDNAIARFDGETGKAIQGGTNAPTYSDTGILTVEPSAVTGSGALSSLEINQAWNTSGAPTAVQVNVTRTSSSTAANLLDLRTGNATKFRVDYEGALFIAGASNQDILCGGNGVSVGAPNNILASLSGNLRLRGGRIISWNDGTASNPGMNVDLQLVRGGPGILQQYNGANAQKYWIHNTWTSATNFERFSIAWGSNLCTLSTEKGGDGGTQRPMLLSAGTETIRLDLASIPTTDPVVAGALWRDGTDLKISLGA